MFELVRVETDDGLFLDGALQRPRDAGPLPVDAFLLLHGTGSNFYTPGVLESFARQAVAYGAAVLRVNTRGHDGICSISGRQGQVRGGATFERISDCTRDVAAWATWLEANGLARIVLVGHSMGGVKAIYSQAQTDQPAVQAIVGISPPRFAHERLAAGPRGVTFREEFARASELVRRGDGDSLVPVTQPLSFIATAAGYVEKYGPENRYDFVPLLSRLPCPALILIGSESIKTSAAFAGLPDALAEAADGNLQLAYEIVEGANTNYLGCDTIPFVRTAAWIQAGRVRKSSGP
jgi:pimeloyl-ACP methyl ester carboxylesterase